MDFDTFLNEAWNRHANDPAGVAATLADAGLPLATTEDRVLALAHLAHHVHGEHLGWWQVGRELQARLATLPTAPRDGPGAGTLRGYRQALAVCDTTAAASDPWAGMDEHERIGVAATAAANLALHDTPRAARLLQQALDAAEAAALPATDPAARALAVGANNLASTLEQLPSRTEAQRTLMVHAAAAARRWWAVAGTWLQVERAEYRLASVCLAAGDTTRAQTHAQACLDIVQAEGQVALEHFFAWEMLARVAHARGDAAALAAAVAAAEAGHAALAVGDQGWSLASLQAVQHLRGPT